jgi:hypothetical protein
MGMHLEGVGEVHFFQVTNVWRAEDTEEKIRTAKGSHEMEEDRREEKRKEGKGKEKMKR